MTRRTYLMIVCVVVLELIGAALWMRQAHADEPFVFAKPPCYPLVSALTGQGKVIDTRLAMKAETDVLLWFCDTDKGMQAHYRTGNFGRPCEECFRVDITIDQLAEIDKAAFRRPPTPAEQVQVDKAFALYEPRCPMATTAKTTQVRSLNLDRTIGAVRTDAANRIVRVPVGKAECYDWVHQDGRLYCSVTGQLDTHGQEIAPSSYVLCRVQTAPKDGWPK